jgi:ribosomal protein S21
METKEQEAYEDMKKIINFTFADMKYHDLLEEIKQKEKNKES